AGQGVMGSIRIPKIDVNLPIYHGTSEDALAVGAGHLYGTSLPVGGKSTHSVITGHRGLPNSLLFTRLDEMKKGDSFYIEVMGKTLGYKV
ncbi:sortase, partial [[Eubacterium] rectale]|nr:sortase [Agathobacter rectalis]